MSLMKAVHDQHVTTETENGIYCWSCTLATGLDVPYPCPTVGRAVELEELTPLDNPPAPVEEPAPEEPAPADPPATETPQEI